MTQSFMGVYGLIKDPTTFAMSLTVYANNQLKFLTA